MQRAGEDKERTEKEETRTEPTESLSNNVFTLTRIFFASISPFLYRFEWSPLWEKQSARSNFLRIGLMTEFVFDAVGEEIQKRRSSIAMMLAFSPTTRAADCLADQPFHTTGIPFPSCFTSSSSVSLFVGRLRMVIRCE
ncbi:hypothetical protein R1flu_003178 [Riccia fluitans]|uniref:Uncharacterized protein n=1 Tax=Riccia fluitans TaxID=41844 RepID=A0ABD1Y893_9MARC